jgi:chemotaxis protein MotB
MARRSRTTASGADTWAGFVDALSTLLVVLIFALVVLMLAQFFQGIALSGRDAALAQLEDRVAELADMLSLERDSNADLRLEMAQFSSELQRATSGRDEAEQALALLSAERDGLIARLTATENYAADAGKALDDAQARIELLQSDLDRAMEDITVSKDSLSLKLAEVASLQRDIDALRDVRDNLEADVARMVLLLEEAKGLQARTAEELTQSERELAASRERIEALLIDLTAERDRSMALEASLSDETERTVLAQNEIEERDIRLSELAQLVTMTQEERDAAEAMSDRRLNQLALLNQQLEALRSQIAALNEVLEASEAQAEADQVQIAELGARLNTALAAKVQELSRYRSEFFEKLVQVLSDRTDIVIVGDRFVLPSELLFDSGSAEISPEGRPELDKIADLIVELTGEIPDDVEWVLRVDGHTDNVPIATNQFPSNWELSTARATSVVRYLVSRGVAPDHLAAAGFGEFQPITTENTDDGRRQNRRIEFKLTEK